MPTTRFAQLSRVARRCALAAAVGTSLVAASCGEDDSPTVEDASGTTTSTTSVADATTTTAATSGSTAPGTPTSAPGPRAGERFRVTMEDFAFKPSAITVQPGVIVTWTNLDSTAHTVTADNGEFDQQLSQGKGFGRPFNKAGTFPYHCKIHPSMTGTVTVQ